jgi:hypothetical protein
MGNYIFIPDTGNIFSLNGTNRGEIHYRFNTQIPTSVSWTSRQKLLFKLQYSSDWETERNMLPKDEEIEFLRLFDKINEIPEENIIKNCLLVIISRLKGINVAIGLRVINHNNYVVFKSGYINEIKILCKKNYVTINYDNNYTLYLLYNAYLDEIIPEDIWGYTARKYIKLKKRDKIFSVKFKQLFFS